MPFAEFFVNFVKISSCKKRTKLNPALRIIVDKKKTAFEYFYKNY